MAIIDGMEMDLTQTRYLDFPGLQRYAGMSPAWSASCRPAYSAHPTRNLLYAESSAGFPAHQYHRDVGEDARKGRIYLPVNELQQFKSPPPTSSMQAQRKLRELMRFQAQRAHKML